MPIRSDFQIFAFNEHLGDNPSDINTDFEFKGRRSSEKVFTIERRPFRSGFVQNQVTHVDNLSHQIPINDDSLPGVDVRRTGQGQNTGWQTHTSIIPASSLQRGRDTIRCRQVGIDAEHRNGRTALSESGSLFTNLEATHVYSFIG